MCQQCDGLFTRNSSLNKHKCTVEDDVKFIFPGGAFRAPESIFDTIKERTGLDVLSKWPGLAIYPFRVTYDIESYFPKDDSVPDSTCTTHYSTTHHLLSVSLCSNVPGYTDPVCYVREPEAKIEPSVKIETGVKIEPRAPTLSTTLTKLADHYDDVDYDDDVEDNADYDADEDDDELAQDIRRDVHGDAYSGGVRQVIAQMIHHIRCIALKAYTLMRERWQPVLKEVEQLIQKREMDEKKFAHMGFSTPGTYKYRAKFGRLLEQILAYLGRVPVIGFNSQNYDLNVIKGELLKHLVANDDVSFVVKKCSSMMCVESSFCRFIDASNYIAPGFSYSKYLKAYGCEQTKGHFPYEWMDSLEKLQEPCLPPQEAFYSHLKQSGITDDEYQRCKDVWKEKHMNTFRDFLIWYNNLDVVPFLEALDKQSAVFATKGIDMFKTAISLV